MHAHAVADLTRDFFELRPNASYDHHQKSIPRKRCRAGLGGGTICIYNKGKCRGIYQVLLFGILTYIILDRIPLYDLLLFLMLYHIMLSHTVSYHVTLYHFILYCILLHCAVVYYMILLI